ncbi:MAG TPA: DUF3820 family protein [Desulfopila sp.]|nr:DUF3820 family protein [Desulfopila sp.]
MASPEKFGPPGRRPQITGDELPSEQRYLLELAVAIMPYGRYKGMRLVDLPEPYVVWWSQKGFPEGRLGEMLETVYVIKANGLEYLFTPWK